MVRLKGVAMLSYLREDRKLSFNSTMVRLKDHNPAHITRLTALFQFHNGSIKSRVG